MVEHYGKEVTDKSTLRISSDQGHADDMQVA